MATLILPNDFVNGTDRDAVPVQENFTTIETHLNAERIRRDGTVAFTGAQPGVTPTQSSHLVTKGFMDGKITGPTAFTPQLIAAGGAGSGGTNPNIGSTGVATGSWWKVGDDIAVVEFGIEFGGTGILQGEGSVAITLPFAAARLYADVARPLGGLVTINDASAVQALAVTGHIRTHGDSFFVLQSFNPIGFTSVFELQHTNVGLPWVGITYAAGDDFSGKLFFKMA